MGFLKSVVNSPTPKWDPIGVDPRPFGHGSTFNHKTSGEKVLVPIYQGSILGTLGHSSGGLTLNSRKNGPQGKTLELD